jgi:triacylglycerol lipase
MAEIDHLNRLTDAVERSAFVPEPPAGTAPETRRWWGRHVRELRWQAELARLLVDPIWRGIGVPRGDGSPVLLLPGFMAGSESLAVLNQWLRGVGYRVYRSGIRVNVDCSDRAIDRLDARLQQIHDKRGDKVALIGHSRGGHFAKVLGQRRPELVSGVVSLGAGLDNPFDISVPTKLAVAAVRTFHHRTDDRCREDGCLTTQCGCRFAREYAAPFPKSVPLTSIYSRGDGVVWWEAAVVPYANCVEVSGSHIGLAANRKAYRAIAQALAEARRGVGGSGAQLSADAGQALVA